MVGSAGPSFLASVCASARNYNVTTTTICIGEGLDHEVGYLLSLSVQNLRVEIRLLVETVAKPGPDRVWTRA